MQTLGNIEQKNPSTGGKVPLRVHGMEDLARKLEVSPILLRCACGGVACRKSIVSHVGASRSVLFL